MNRSRYSSMTISQASSRVAVPQQQAVVCPVCGGVECLCRPRFFSGQLLTEEDLNRLDRYIIGKNRLHNRMLFGYGVVNGLEVTCGPCNDQVIVSAGYALSPCGDDIVVCKDTPVDICALANACCNPANTNDCGPYAPQPNPDCQDLEQKWILAICYDEKPSRGVTPLRDTGGQACCSRCNCGGSANCGCGCHTKTSQSQGRAITRSTSSRPPAPQCEPTVICEGYRFTLYQLPKVSLSNSGFSTALAAPLANAASQGELARRFICCINDLLALVQQIHLPPNAGVNELYEWCCSIKAAFQDYLNQNGGTACSLYDALNAFRCPDPNQFPNDPAGYRQAVETQLGQLTGLMQQEVLGCLCSALLPPVPPASADNCVPIATLTLRRKDCHVTNICNTEARKFAITFTNLAYWLSPLESIINKFRQALDRLCCTRPSTKRAVPISPAAFNHARVVRMAGFNVPAQEVPASAGARFRAAWAKRNTAFDTRGLILDTLGLVQPDGSPYVSPLEQSDPIQALLLDNLVVPFLSGLSEPDKGEVKPGGTQPQAEKAPSPAAPAAQSPQPAAAAPQAEELSALRSRLDDLAALVAKQEAQIAELRKARGRNPGTGKNKEGKP